MKNSLKKQQLLRKPLNWYQLLIKDLNEHIQKYIKKFLIFFALRIENLWFGGSPTVLFEVLIKFHGFLYFVSDQSWLQSSVS